MELFMIYFMNVSTFFSSPCISSLQAMRAHTNSEQSRKVTENINKILIKKAAQLEANCNALTHQLEQQWVGHQKAAERIQHVHSSVLGAEERHATVCLVKK